MTTFTKHRLTDPMLKRLSQMANERPHHAGTSMDALVARGLAEHVGENSVYQHSHRITEEGRAALDEARRQGW